jgi:hypothetical protein
LPLYSSGVWQTRQFTRTPSRERNADLGGWDISSFTSSACPPPQELEALQAAAAGQFGRAPPG